MMASGRWNKGSSPRPDRRWCAAEARRLRILSSRLVTGTFAGEYKSMFRGRGIEFEEVREYQPGDEIRGIDWNVTARTGLPYVKRFIEEREMTVMLLLDRSASLDCPTSRGPKSAIAAEVCALLAFAAVRSNDRVGLITFTERIEQYIPPAKGIRQALRIIDDIFSTPPLGRGTDLSCAVDYLNGVCCRGITLCMVSDFHSADVVAALNSVARRHDVVAATITYPDDLEMQDVGLLQAADAENGTTDLIDTGNAKVRRAYGKRTADRWAVLLGLFSAAGVRHMDIRTDSPPIHALLRFFQAHQRHVRR
jgi:uncharacterized protein (DUF58 family)